jgi:hypothetical protein
MKPFKKYFFGDLLYIFLCFITLGLYYLFSRWFPMLYIFVSHVKSTLKKCTLVYIKSKQNQEIDCCKVEEFDIKSITHSKIRYFKYRKLNFVYSEEKDEFFRIE